MLKDNNYWYILLNLQKFQELKSRRMEITRISSEKRVRKIQSSVMKTGKLFLVYRKNLCNKFTCQLLEFILLLKVRKELTGDDEISILKKNNVDLDFLPAESSAKKRWAAVIKQPLAKIEYMLIIDIDFQETSTEQERFGISRIPRSRTEVERGSEAHWMQRPLEGGWQGSPCSQGI